MGRQANADYQRVAQAIRYLHEHRLQQPTLTDVARAIGLSPHHFQRLFVRWAGVSPKQFLGFITAAHAKRRLKSGASVLATALETGLSGPGRLHDLFVNHEAMTPGEYKSQGKDLLVRYGIHPTRFGDALVLTTERGICGLRFAEPGEQSAAVATAQREWALSRFREDRKETKKILQRLLAPLADEENERFLLRGTRFQIKVWSALLSLPAGILCSYSDFAAEIGRPNATRAVSSAIGRNPLALLIPCHRVLRSTGAFAGYRWGLTRKAALIGWETAQDLVAATEPQEDYQTIATRA